MKDKNVLGKYSQKKKKKIAILSIFIKLTMQMHYFLSYFSLSDFKLFITSIFFKVIEVKFICLSPWKSVDKI